MPRVFSGIQPTGERPPRQPPGGAAQLGRRPARRRLRLLRGRPPRPHRPPGPGRAPGHARCELAQILAGGRPRPRRLHAVRAEPRARAHRAGLDDGVHGVASASCSRMTQFKDKSEPGRVRVGRAVHLPGAHGGRHPPLRHRPGAGGRRPAPAPRAHPRPRRPVQLPLRRDLRGPRGRRSRRPAPGSWTCRSPTDKMSKSDDSPQGTIARARRPEGRSSKKIKRAVTDTDAEVRFDPEDQAGRVEPAVDPRPPPPAATPEAWPTGYTQYGPLKADTAEPSSSSLAPDPGALRASSAADPGARPTPLLRPGRRQGRGRSRGHRWPRAKRPSGPRPA